MTEDAMKALDEIEAALDYIRTGTANMPWEAAHVAKILTVLPTLRAALALPAQHSDDTAVDRFAAALKGKLARKRDQGRGGWDDPEQCSAAFLSKLMREHVEKGDPLDVGAFAMMLQQRGEPIQPALAPPADVAGEVEEIRARHEEASYGRLHGYWEASDGDEAHTDCATLLRALDAMAGENARLKRNAEALAPYARLGLAMSEFWPDSFGDINAFDLFEMLKESGVIVKQPEPYDPDKDGYIEDCKAGDDWYMRAVNIGNARAALKEPGQ